MLTQTEKRAILNDLNEDAFRCEVLIPLLKRMGYTRVKERHGPYEYGKDIVFQHETALGITYYAVVAKVGDVSGSASGKDNLSVVINQVRMAFEIPAYDIETRNEIRANHVVVWTTGRISNHAEEQIKHLNSGLQNVVFKDGDTTIELLEEHYPAFFTVRDPVVSEYYTSTKEYYSRIEELRALGYISDEVRLSVIFVPPKLAPFRRRTEEFKQSQLPHVKLPGGTSEDLQSYTDFLRDKSNAFVVGAAGSGKTTLLRRVLLDTIEMNERQRQRTPIPILIDFKKVDLDAEDPFAMIVEAEFQRFCIPDPEVSLKQELQNGGVLVLIDGLDELKTEQATRSALEQLVQFTRTYNQIRVIATSRLTELFEKQEILTGYLAGFSTLEIESLTPDQMREFIVKWYGEDSSTGQRLAHLIGQPAGLGGLPPTPLTLTLVAILCETGTKELPANLTELFTKYIELALGRWDASRGISLQFEWKIKEYLLRCISWELHSRRETEISQSHLKDLLIKVSEERGLSIEPDLFTDEIIGRSELLYRDTEGMYVFKHRSFQEYFVGQEIKDKSDSVDFVIKHFLDIWWTQPIFFACGLRPESADYLEAILSLQIPEEDQLLAAVCLGQIAQATYLAPKRVKAAAVQQAIHMLVEHWDYICVLYDDFKDELKKHSEAFKEMPFHVMLLTFLTAVAKEALGSITLKAVFSDLANNYLTDTQEELELTERQAVVREWEAYLLASVSAEADDIETFLMLVNSGIISQLSFVTLLRTQAMMIQGHRWLDAATRADVEDITKTLTKKIGRKKKQLEGLFRKGPMPLPPKT